MFSFKTWLLLFIFGFLLALLILKIQDVLALEINQTEIQNKTQEIIFSKIKTNFGVLGEISLMVLLVIIFFLILGWFLGFVLKVAFKIILIISLILLFLFGLKQFI